MNSIRILKNKMFVAVILTLSIFMIQFQNCSQKLFVSDVEHKDQNGMDFNSDVDINNEDDGYLNLSSQDSNSELNSLRSLPSQNNQTKYDITKDIVTVKGKGTTPISISVDKYLFAGAVSSLKWDEFEFINIRDHGRQLQSAMQVDGFKECNNPTEAGSEVDAAIEILEIDKGKSSSALLKLKKKANQLATQTQMAYWVYNTDTLACTPPPPNCALPNCDPNAYGKGLDPRVYDVGSPLSQQVLTKKITIGYHKKDNPIKDNNIIAYDVMFTLKDGTVNEKAVFEFLTGYLVWEIRDFYYVNAQTKELIKYNSNDLRDISGMGFPQGSYQGLAQNKNIFDPVILSAENKRYAMGVYTSRKAIENCKSSFHGYNLYKFNDVNGEGRYANRTTKWSLALEDSISSSCFTKTKSGDLQRSFRVYIAIGNLKSVHEKLKTLITLVP